jgi:hypothetical protein
MCAYVEICSKLSDVLFWNSLVSAARGSPFEPHSYKPFDFWKAASVVRQEGTAGSVAACSVWRAWSTAMGSCCTVLVLWCMLTCVTLSCLLELTLCLFRDIKPSRECSSWNPQLLLRLRVAAQWWLPLRVTSWLRYANSTLFLREGRPCSPNPAAFIRKHEALFLWDTKFRSRTWYRLYTSEFCTDLCTKVAEISVS